MLKKIISLSSLLCMTIGMVSAQEFSGKLYIEDTTVAQGETVILPVLLSNNIEIRGFEFTLTLPQGINYSSWALSSERLPNGVNTKDQLSMQSYKENHLRIASILNYDKSAAFSGSMGEIALISVSIDPNISEGEYTLLLSDIDVATPEGKDYSDFDPVPVTLNVVSPLAITSVTHNSEVPFLILNAMGIRKSTLSSGVNILRHANGTSEKLWIE